MGVKLIQQIEIKPQMSDKDKLHPLTPLKEYYLEDQSTNFMIKNNMFVTIEEYRDDEKKVVGPLSSTDTQILTTSFMMAHELNENNINYDAETVFKIDLEKFCKLWKIEITEEDKSTGLIYHNIKNSIKRLQSRSFIYLDLESNQPVQSSYFAYIEYGNNYISFGFPKPFIQYLKRMDRFTWYYLENIIKLLSENKQYALSSYAVTLYENLQKEKNFAPIVDGKKVIFFSVPKLRKLFGLVDVYQRNTEFKRNILDKIIVLIDKHTNLKITIEGIKEGKEITKYKFICEFPAHDLDFAKAVSKKKADRLLLSAPQRKKFSKLLAENVGFCAVYRKENEVQKDFIARIEKQLMENLKAIEYWPYLKAVGCKSRNIEKLANPRIYGPAAEHDDEDIKF
ncbi:replication initiation protein [Acinetobacter sp. SwsAc5]|uniref:replication initiation protein n=1 Tax=Acinetobacter sp. SwsAc5 TaxID=2749438 RepID=UPI0015BBAAD4|nr:replication initiation protein [Acinetobacter sp. SwsAc5]NWK53738.1 replication initiation protein [Acinetobacter sp. SwsAc5]